MVGEAFFRLAAAPTADTEPDSPFVQFMSEIGGGLASRVAHEMVIVNCLFPRGDAAVWPRTPEPGSLADAGNAVFSSLTSVGAEVAARLSIGAEHLHHLAVHYANATSVHLHADFTVLRAAIEAVATAWWVAEPKDLQTRVQRALQVRSKDALFETDAMRGLAEWLDPGQLPFEQRFKKARDEEAQAHDIDPDKAFKKLPSITQILKRFDEAHPRRDLLRRWQVASGHAHGYSWASHHFAVRTTSPSDGGEILAPDFRLIARLFDYAYAAMAEANLAWERLALADPSAADAYDEFDTFLLPGWADVDSLPQFVTAFDFEESLLNDEP